MSPPLGLSPCVRGYQRFGKVAEDDCGSIPVCTGLPSPSTCLSSVPRVYPRVYGATSLMLPIAVTFWGLSPCVRGYLERGFHPAPRPGSIPVCTGLPIVGVSEALLHGVYPRVYGATVRIVLWMVLSAGLSPCVRGYQLRARAPRVAHGSIPVCTGLPTALRRPAPMTGVYPRVYGATHARGTPSDPGPGLSPCVRGYHLLLASRHRIGGSIPVCTGLPAPSVRRPAPSRVYPRVYGATVVLRKVRNSYMGLSPCVRGYPRERTCSSLGNGSIPVCTGLPLLQSVTVPAWKEHFLSFYPFSASLCRKGGGLRRATCSPTTT